MGFNSAFKGLKLFKKPGNGRLNNLNDPVLNVLMCVNLLGLITYKFLIKIISYMETSWLQGIFSVTKNLFLTNHPEKEINISFRKVTN